MRIFKKEKFGEICMAVFKSKDILIGFTHDHRERMMITSCL